MLIPIAIDSEDELKGFLENLDVLCLIDDETATHVRFLPLTLAILLISPTCNQQFNKLSLDELATTAKFFYRYRKEHNKEIRRFQVMKQIEPMGNENGCP